jgi:hypothetical protein
MALTTITCIKRDPVDACHEINNLNVQTPLPPQTTDVCGFTI